MDSTKHFFIVAFVNEHLCVSLLVTDFTEFTNKFMARLIFLKTADKENNLAAAGNFAYAIYRWLYKEMP